MHGQRFIIFVNFKDGEAQKMIRPKFAIKIRKEQKINLHYSINA